MPVFTYSRSAIAAMILFAAPTLAQTIQGLPPVPQPDHEALLKNADGSWKYTNRLIDTDSPYLLQHAHNPVDWYPWGADALAAARELDKPIFLSVGYSTCYWCHVMEREVFSNPEIAAIMNELFINIKVDREQRPDLDQIYMTVTQLLTGRGGWPNSVFLTPDLKPFWAATYIGPEDIPGPPGQRGRPGFPTVITALSDAWANQREAVEASADQLATAIVNVLTNQNASTTPTPLSQAIPDGAIEQLALSYDPVNGGFSVAPKFPNDFTYSFLFRVHERTGDERTLDMALNTLRHMAAGGLHDHVGGGFHRYSTDGKWRVPHFEKMLYNQGQLARAYLEAYERTGDEHYAGVVRGILRYVERRMSDPAGPFYSALDAETDAVEGEYYVWNRDQIESLLDEEQLQLFDNVFLLADVPIFPGHKHPDGGVMCMKLPLAELAAQLDTTPTELTASLAPILSALAQARTPRTLPRLDDKAIVAWNALMIDAYALAGRVLKDDTYTARARAAADFILSTMRDDTGQLQRIWRNGHTSQDAFLEDYAFLADALISLHRTTGDDQYLDSAIELVAQANALFWDDSEDGGGGYFFAAWNADLIARSKSSGDRAIPSGNSVMAHTLLDLAELTGDDEYADRARVLLGVFAEQMTRSPSSHVHMVHAVDRLLAREPKAIPMTPIVPMDVVEPPDVRGVAGAGIADSSARVDVSARVDRASLQPGDAFVVTVTLDMDEGWHVNANPASAEYLIPTVADVRSDLPVTVANVMYPAAHELSLAGEPIQVYGSGAAIRVSCVLGDDATPGPGTLRVVVGYQACDDQSCLAPAETVVEIAVTVGQR
ncbi:MAG: DUF255 domain-containing protein [Planctomycetes bacterium]|nr:DUF255 domain-containing protein [Planctomycetota bacterium]